MDIKKELQTIYDKISGEFSSSRVFPWEELQVFIPYIKSGFKVLDLGCGNGRLIKTLEDAKVDLEYTGVDFSQRLIDYAKKQHPDRRFIFADISKITFPKESFDMVFIVATFHHLYSKEEREKLLENIYTWLKPGGLLVMTNWNLMQPKYLKNYFQRLGHKKSWRDFFVSWQMYSEENKKFWRYYHSFGKKELENLLKKSGFEMNPKGVYFTKWNINAFVMKRGS